MKELFEKYEEKLEEGAPGSLESLFKSLKKISDVAIGKEKKNDTAGVVLGLVSILDIFEVIASMAGKQKKEPRLKQIAKKVKPISKEFREVASEMYKERQDRK